MNKIEKLHALFLSGSPSDWQQATAMCTETEFEQIVNLEVERLKEDESFELEVKKDPDDGPCVQALYKHQLILGGQFILELWMWNKGGTGVHVTSVSREFYLSNHHEVWSDYEYDEDAISRNEDPFAVCGTVYPNRGTLSNDQYPNEYFKLEIEAVKDRWRTWFKNTKAELAAV